MIKNFISYKADIVGKLEIELCQQKLKTRISTQITIQNSLILYSSIFN